MPTLASLSRLAAAAVAAAACLTVATDIGVAVMSQRTYPSSKRTTKPKTAASATPKWSGSTRAWSATNRTQLVAPAVVGTTASSTPTATPSTPSNSSPVATATPEATTTTTGTTSATATPTTPSASTASGWWVPAQRSSWQIQYSGTLDPTLPVSVYDLDGADTPASSVAQLAARGVRTLCYINAGAWENWRADRGSFPTSVLGNDMSGWAGERWLDIRRVDVLIPLMRARMQTCRDKGFDAVDADNVMGFQERTGFSLTAADQLAYNRALASTAHNLGLGFGLKNDADQINALVADVDFAVNEECVAERSCSAYAPMLAAGKAVFNIEYAGSLASVCAIRPDGFSTLVKSLELTATRTACPL
jgi:hypothetical protein